MSAIDDHVNQIVQNIVAQITTQVQAQATETINQKIDEVIGALDYTQILSGILAQKLDQRLSQLPIDSTSIQDALNLKVSSLADNLSNNIQAQSLKTINETISAYVNKIDFNTTFQTTLLAAIQNQKVSFPASSIDHTSVDYTGFTLSGNNIKAGIIENFGSTGIDDKATACQLTILDDVTVVENNLLTKDLTVKGTTTIEGDLNVTGTLPETSPLFISVVKAATNNVCTSAEVFNSFANKVVGQITANGIDLSQVTIQGKVAIDGNSLGGFVVNSNLQKVGELKELVVQGEAYLGQTLYTNSQRVGINTIEPSQALSIWDQEIELGMGKQATNTAIFGTPRSHTLILSSNGKNNLTLTPDGAVSLNQINLGTISITSSSAPPSTNQPRGTIVFNASPSLGGPLGWVSLGDAKWANFGIID